MWLSMVRSSSSDSALIGRLSTLVARARSAVTGAHAPLWSEFRKFWTVSFPVVAYRCWGAGVARVGPATAAFFANLTPLFAGLMSTLMLGEPPHAYHVLGFVLIVGGILVSSRR